MRITGVPLDDFSKIVASVSADVYRGNVTVDRAARAVSERRCQGRLNVLDSQGLGARRGASGRRMRAACWHAYRDVLMELFDQYPDAKVYTGMAKYLGRDDFLAKFEATGDRNMGSRIEYTPMAELCDCERED